MQLKNIIPCSVGKVFLQEDKYLFNLCFPGNSSKPALPLGQMLLQLPNNWKHIIYNISKYMHISEYTWLQKEQV